MISDRVVLNSARAVSISNRAVLISDKTLFDFQQVNDNFGAKRGAKANSCPRPQTKVKVMSREAISEKNVLK